MRMDDRNGEWEWGMGVDVKEGRKKTKDLRVGMQWREVRFGEVGNV